MILLADSRMAAPAHTGLLRGVGGGLLTVPRPEAWSLAGSRRQLEALKGALTFIIIPAPKERGKAALLSLWMSAVLEFAVNQILFIFAKLFYLQNSVLEEHSKRAYSYQRGGMVREFGGDMYALLYLK